MNEGFLQRIKGWVDDFAGQFMRDDEHVTANIRLKLHHTYRVETEIKMLAKSLALSVEDTCIARTIALLHDVGRFPQFAKYGTYNDLDSESHAQLSVQAINESNLLDDLLASDSQSRNIIVTAVGLHSHYALPDWLDERTEFFCKLIRDADKLDVWKVFIEADLGDDPNTKVDVLFNMPSEQRCSSAILASLRAEQLPKRDLMKTQADFKLLLMGWVYDLHFPATFKAVRDRDYIGTLARGLPDFPGVVDAVETVERYLNGNGVCGGMLSSVRSIAREGGHSCPPRE